MLFMFSNILFLTNCNKKPKFNSFDDEYNKFFCSLVVVVVVCNPH